jgi:hypothetical protein
LRGHKKTLPQYGCAAHALERAQRFVAQRGLEQTVTLRLDDDRFLPNLFQLIIHVSPNYSMIYILENENVIK